MAKSDYQPGQLRCLSTESTLVRIMTAATAGNPCAQYVLGLILLNGAGYRQDDCKAALWIRKAAEQGLPRAQNDLAALCAEGRGLRRDLQQALFWLRRAADQGLPVAHENLKRLREHSIPPHALDSAASPPSQH